MRILMVSWRGPGHRHAGGAEAYTLRVLTELARRGHVVAWLCEEQAPGVRGGVRLVPGGSGAGLHLAARRFIRANSGEYDLVVDQINVVGFLTPLYSPLPVVALIHQRAAEVWRFDGPPVLRVLGPAAESAGLRPYRRTPFVTVSASTLRDLRAAGWQGPGAIAHNGVDVPRDPPPRKACAPTIAFLGRLQARAKRLSHTLAAFGLVRRRVPAARLWVIGRGVPPIPAPAGVTFFPDVADARRDVLLAQSWLLVATSVREGWGRMVLEAAAAGTPALAYDAPGLAEAAFALGGTVVPQSPEALAHAAAGLLESPGRLREAGVRARALAQGFSWDRAVDVWEHALAQAVRAGPPGRRVPSA